MDTPFRTLFIKLNTSPSCFFPIPVMITQPFLLLKLKLIRKLNSIVVINDQKYGGHPMYGVEPFFWTKLFLILAVFVILTAAFNAILRKWLKVEKPKLFSFNYVNDKHKKIDRRIRVLFIVLMIAGSSINVLFLPGGPYFFLQPWFLLFVLIFTAEIVRAVMERKYAENPNAHIYTLCQSAFLLVLLLLLFTTDFFGVFESGGLFL